MSPQIKQRIKLAVVVIAVIILLIILLQNTHATQVTILFKTFSLPLVAWLLIVLAAGFVLGYFTRSLLRRRKLVPHEKTIA